MNLIRTVFAGMFLLAVSGQLSAQVLPEKAEGDFGHGPALKESPDGVLDINYQVNSFAFDFRDISATGTPVGLADDAVSGALPIGFAFEFYGTEYTEAYISSNGFVTFNAGSPNGCCSGQSLPNPATPNNLVALFWEDLNPVSGGTIRYQTFGAAPNREFVVGFYDIQHFGGGNAVSMEMILREGSNIVELQYLTAPSDGGTHSTGVESDGGMRATQVDFGGAYSYSNEGFVLLPIVGLEGNIVDADYQSSPIALNLRDISASGTAVTLSDDSVSSALPLGFTFEYYGPAFTEAHISSNGFVTFSAGSSNGCCSGQSLPSPALPNNLIALYWEDLNPSAGGTILYQTLGAAPSREFVVGFYDIQHFGGGNAVNMEMILHEGSNNVELQYLTAPSDGGTHSTGVESDGGLFGTQVDFGNYSYANEGFLLTPQGIEVGDSIARFPVEKLFDDGNPGEVQVSIDCNTGLPLSQTTTIAQGDGVTFVVTDFNEGELDCEITETSGANGYDQEYFFGDASSDESCVYEGVEFETANVCIINNVLEPVEVVVTKEWIDDNPQFNAQNIAEATFSCVNEQFQQAFGTLRFVGNGDTDSFDVFPHWDGTTVCDVTESFLEGGVEADSSDCQGLSVTPGSGASCTIVNTRLFEGIPTLSQYGLALLAMLMLGIGFVAFRRIA